MGVDYSTTIAYGFHGDTEENLPEVLQKIKDAEGYLGEEYVAPWLDENNFDLLDFAEVGNWMSGETEWLFCLKRTYAHYYHNEAEGVYTFGELELTQAEQDELGRIRVLLDSGDPQWVVAFNIS